MYIAKQHRYFIQLIGTLGMLFKYINEKCSSYFLSMQCTNRCPLNIVALQDYQKIMVIRWHLWVHMMRRKCWNSFSLCIFISIHSLPLSKEYLLSMQDSHCKFVENLANKGRNGKNHGQFRNSWEVMRKLWKIHEKVVIKSRESHEQDMRK